MRNKKATILFVIAILLIWLSWIDRDGGNPLLDTSIAMDAEKKVKSIDRDKFINYKTTNRTKNSKELIAVVFNTDNKFNLGFIDEYGNVIKEPFLEAKDYDYYETLRGETGVDSFFNEYYQTRDDNGNYVYYDRNFKKVSLSTSEQEDYERKYSESRSEYKYIDGKEFRVIKKHLDKLLKKGYSNSSHITYTGDIYNFRFGYRMQGYDILLDDKYELLTPLYFVDRSNLGLFAPPENDSIVGNFFIEDYGLYYYNTFGDIIWVTYVKHW